MRASPNWVLLNGTGRLSYNIRNAITIPIIDMRKQITFTHQTKRVGIAWLSFQPGGSISCGLRDRTYIAPNMRTRIHIWSAYNRVGIRYVVPSNPETLMPIENPHFTYHPLAMFHLKAHNAISSRDEDIFSGIADLSIVLHQQPEMPWLRFVSGPVATLPPAGAPRADGIGNSELLYTVPTFVDAASASIEVDFIRRENVQPDRTTPPWEFVWHNVGVRIKPAYIPPQIATLSWFHFY